METKITATELARNLSDILNRVRYRGERFIVERNGETVAVLAPDPSARKVRTVGEFVELMRTLPPVDDEFSDDLRQIRAMQGKLPSDPWQS